MNESVSTVNWTTQGLQTVSSGCSIS